MYLFRVGNGRGTDVGDTRASNASDESLPSKIKPSVMLQIDKKQKKTSTSNALRLSISFAQLLNTNTPNKENLCSNPNHPSTHPPQASQNPRPIVYYHSWPTPPWPHPKRNKRMSGRFFLGHRPDAQQTVTPLQVFRPALGRTVDLSAPLEAIVQT